MRLPSDIRNGLNLELSRHKDPDSLNWQLVRGRWTAREGDKQFVVLQDDKLGYIIFETRKVQMSIDMGVDQHWQ